MINLLKFIIAIWIKTWGGRMIKRVCYIFLLSFMIILVSGCQSSSKPKATLTNIVSSENAVSFEVNITDKKQYLQSVSAILYDNYHDTKINEEVLQVGKNEVQFTGINDPSLYSIEIRGTYTLNKTLKENDLLTKSDSLGIFFPIYNISDLNKMDMNLNYILKDDIDFNLSLWSTLGDYNGTFDGNGHLINGLNNSLFHSITDKGKIMNLGFVDFTNNFYFNLTNTIAVTNNGVIENVYVSGGITNQTYEGNIGGIVSINKGTIKESFVDLDINSSGGNIGGIAGINQGTIKNSYAMGSLTSKNSTIGGLVGKNDSGTIQNSYAINDIDLDVNVQDISIGGLVGYSSGRVENCFANNNIVINNNSSTTELGSIVGQNTGNKIINSYRYKAQAILLNNYRTQNYNDNEDVLIVNSFKNSSAYNQLLFDPNLWIITDNYYPHLKKFTYEAMPVTEYDNSFISGVSDQTIKLGSNVDLLSGVYGYDRGNTDMAVTVNINNTSTLSAGPHELTYNAHDRDGNNIFMTSTLVVVDDSRKNSFSFTDMPVVDNLKTPIVNISQFDDYLYTMFESGSSSSRFYCDTLSCQTFLTDDYLNTYYYMMALNQSYDSVAYIDFWATDNYIKIESSEPYYTDTMIEQIDKEADYILSQIITFDMTEREMIKAIHDYINNKVDYDDLCVTNGNQCGNSHNAFGVFFSDKAVCDGYAQAFDILARKLGIITHRLPSVMNGEHVWNVVYINGTWLHIDCTWDDTGYSNSAKYEYFLITTSQLHQLDPSTSHQFDAALFSHIN